MKFLQIDNPSEILPIGCRLLHLFGLGRDNRFKLVYWIQCLIYLVFSIIPRILLQIDDVVMLLRLSSEIVFIIYLCLQIGALYFRRAHLYQLVDMLEQCTQQPYSEEIQTFFIRSNVKINKSSIAYVRFFLVIYILYCTMSPIASCMVYVRNMRNETGEQEEFIISSEMNLYYLDIRYNPLHYAIYAGIMFVLSGISSLSLCTKDVVDIAAIKSATLMFQITARQIRELHGQFTQKQLNRVIKSHRDTLLCKNKLQAALNLSLLFQLASCSGIWCLMVFYILLMGLDSRILNLILLLLIVSIETYAYCALGTQLTESGEDVLMAIQQLSWNDQSVTIQRQILFMIRRSQVPIAMTAANLFYANVLQFSQIVQKSYSFFLVLKNVF
uniref:Uncharacterized protein n=1 Tax=Anopheles funestus TaxID=62324 RepID=A0A182S5A0_ANOFN